MRRSKCSACWVSGCWKAPTPAALAIELARARAAASSAKLPVTGHATRAQTLGVGISRRLHRGRIACIVELKAMDAVADVHRAQLLSYLRLSGLRLGLLINFHAFPVVKGIQRVVNKL